MKKSLKVTLCVVALLAVSVTSLFGSMATENMSKRREMPTDVREGDVIFVESKSQQSSLIKLGIRSHITHCGIIVMKGGQPYVLETLKTLKLTPLRQFINRADGYWLKRPKHAENIKIKYRQYLGKPYDLGFKKDNGIYYCSELVYDIYQKQLGIELCEMKQVSAYLILGTNNVPKIKKAMKRRGITMNQEVVAPKDIFYSDELRTVND